MTLDLSVYWNGWKRKIKSTSDYARIKLLKYLMKKMHKNVVFQRKCKNIKTYLNKT